VGEKGEARGWRDGPGDKFQFERNGYFRADPDGAPWKPVFNQTVTLRDTWAKIEKGVKSNKSS
jgi:glutaminyl-tRNA synthetase